MTDREVNYAKMARQLYRVLTDQRPQWEARTPAAVADFEQLNAFLQAIDEVATRQGGQGSAEYSDSRDRAEHAAEEAAGRLVRGLRTLHGTVPNPAIAKAAGYTPDQLDPLHGPLGPAGTPFADAVEVVGQVAAAARRRLGVVGAVSPWQLVAAVTNGRLLAPGGPVRVANTN